MASKKKSSELQNMSLAAYNKLQKEREKIIAAAVLKETEAYAQTAEFRRAVRNAMLEGFDYNGLDEILGYKAYDKVMKYMVDKAFPFLSETK
jgi:hypothetical protein